MTWFKVDDNFAFHPKVMEAGNAAVGLWVRCGAWSMSHLTDGFVPLEMIKIFKGKKSDADRLVQAGLWIAEEDGYRFHDWGQYQPTRESVQETRAAWAERQKRARKLRPTKVSQVSQVSQDDVVPEEGVTRDSRVSHANVTSPVTARQTRDSASPVPVPVPDRTKRVSDGARAASAAPAAQRLLAEWLERCSQRPPSRVIGHLAREIKTLLDDGICEQDIGQGIQNWQAKGLHPSTLASCVHEHRSAVDRSIPEFSQRTRDNLAVVAHFRRLESLETTGDAS